VVHVARSDDKTDRDAANELVLVDRERNKFLTSGVQALTDKSDDLGVFAALRALFVGLSAQSQIQPGLPLALLAGILRSRSRSRKCPVGEGRHAFPRAVLFGERRGLEAERTVGAARARGNLVRASYVHFVNTNQSEARKEPLHKSQRPA
jgi:hypothetical protein